MASSTNSQYNQLDVSDHSKLVLDRGGSTRRKDLGVKNTSEVSTISISVHLFLFHREDWVFLIFIID